MSSSDLKSKISLVQGRLAEQDPSLAEELRQAVGIVHRSTWEETTRERSIAEALTKIMPMPRDVIWRVKHTTENSLRAYPAFIQSDRSLYRQLTPQAKEQLKTCVSYLADNFTIKRPLYPPNPTEYGFEISFQLKFDDVIIHEEEEETIIAGVLNRLVVLPEGWRWDVTRTDKHNLQVILLGGRHSVNWAEFSPAQLRGLQSAKKLLEVRGFETTLIPDPPLTTDCQISLKRLKVHS